METCEIDIALEGADVTRRVRIPSAALLGDLHVLIQTAMGWNDTRFHTFVIDDEVLGDRDDEDFTEAHPDADHEDDFELADVFTEPSRNVTYTYGTWTHRLALNAMVDSDEERPGCVSGKGTCPADPDDEVPFDLAVANARINDAFVTIPDYDADIDQDPVVWQETELDDMLPIVLDYLDTRGELTDADARVLRAHLQVLAEAMMADGESPELSRAIERFRESGLTRSEAIDAMVALMTEFPQVLDEEAEDAFDAYLETVDTYEVEAFKKRFPQSAAGAVRALADQIADRDRNRRKRQRPK